LEEFLFRAIGNLYDLDKNSCAKIMSRLRVLHPYGQIAPLKWQQMGGTAFGECPSLDHAAEAIRTFSEQVSDTTLQSELDHAVTSHERILFLGFGFIEENMEVIRPRAPMERKPIRGTAYGFSDSNRILVERQLENWLHSVESQDLQEHNPSVQLTAALTCSEFLDQHSRFIIG